MFTTISSDPIRTNGGSYQSRTIDLQVEKDWVDSISATRFSSGRRKTRSPDLRHKVIQNCWKFSNFCFWQYFCLFLVQKYHPGSSTSYPINFGRKTANLNQICHPISTSVDFNPLQWISLFLTSVVTNLIQICCFTTKIHRVTCGRSRAIFFGPKTNRNIVGNKNMKNFSNFGSLFVSNLDFEFCADRCKIELRL